MQFWKEVLLLTSYYLIANNNSSLENKLHRDNHTVGTIDIPGFNLKTMQA